MVGRGVGTDANGTVEVANGCRPAVDEHVEGVFVDAIGAPPIGSTICRAFGRERLAAEGA